MRIWTVGAALLAVSGPAYAQSVPDIEALRRLPFEEAFSQSRESGGDVSVEALRYLARLSLAQLYYPVDLRTPFKPLDDPDTVAAIAGFETKIATEVDGSLTFGELEQLFRLAFLSRLTPLSPGMGKSVTVFDGVSPSIYASGSWSMPDIAYPLNRSKIICRTDTGFCEDHMISISAPTVSGANADLQSYIVHEATDTYEIQSWKDGILDAVTGTTCRRVRLTINTRTELVSQTVEDLDPLGCPIPGTEQRLDPIVGLRVATHIDTWQAQQAFQGRTEEAARAASGPLWDALSATND
ncbi:MAG: hypothetical protein EON59_02185 [Alphaproteobacteria bacterium]|nr:MAG: hypothetical protein EON59_02185 [Alphaproteobacteria bacterium]